MCPFLGILPREHGRTCPVLGVLLVDATPTRSQVSIPLRPTLAIVAPALTLRNCVKCRRETTRCPGQSSASTPQVSKLHMPSYQMLPVCWYKHLQTLWTQFTFLRIQHVTKFHQFMVVLSYGFKCLKKYKFNRSNRRGNHPGLIEPQVGPSQLWLQREGQEDGSGTDDEAHDLGSRLNFDQF